MPRPRGNDWLEDEIKSLQLQGVHVLVSLLTPSEVRELELEQEARQCKQYAIQFYSYPIVDRSIPDSTSKFMEKAKILHTLLSKGKGIAIHCRQGIGRSSLMAGTILMLNGCTSEEAFQHIESARLRPVPDTDEQRQWLKKIDIKEY